MREKERQGEASMSDRGSVVNPGSEDDELLHSTDRGIEPHTALDVGQRHPPKPAPDGVPDQDDESRSDGGESGAGGLPIETH